MKALFFNVDKLENFILERELNSHKSFLDNYYFVGKISKKMKNKYKNIIEIEKKYIKNYDYDYEEDDKKNFQYDLDLISVKENYDINNIKAKQIDNCYKFNNYNNKFIFIDDIEYELNLLYHQENILKVTKRVLDDFNWEKYKPLTHKIKTFKTLKKHISNNYNNEVSQAFLKMYEILEVFKLFDLRKKEFKTFHFCEAPGQFIKSIEYYLKSKNKKLDWHAQSLKVKKDNKYNPLGDVYNLIRDNPKRWTYGPDDSGDITNEEVVKSYSETCKDVTLITSDCGLSSNTPFEMTYHDKILSYLNYCQIIAILYNLPMKGNFVVKVFLPQTVNYLVSLNYILINCFQEFYIYKPYLNPQSSEVYLIAKNYNKLDNKTLNKLFILKDKLNIEKGFLKIDKTFLKEYQKCFIKFILQNLNNIKLNIFFYINNVKIDNNKLKEIQNKNNQFWIENFKFPKNEENLYKDIFL